MYLEFNKEASPEECTGLLEKMYLQIVEVKGERELVVEVTREARNPVKTARLIQKQHRKLVGVAEPELSTPIASKGFVLPQDRLLKDQWHLQNTGYHRGTSIGLTKGADARVVEAWKELDGLGSPKITVAVIDDGFDLKHPDLKGEYKIVYPWDFTRNNNNPMPGPVYYDPREGELIGNWHGTACAGVAVGNVEGGNIIGAAPLAKLMPIRWSAGLSDTEVESWFNHAANNGADIISCSWGAANPYFKLSTRIHRVIEKCATEGRDGKGSVIVFAAGNSNHNINDPTAGTLDGFAIHPNVIAVAASTSTDIKSHYSNYGEEISVCAPSSGAGGMGILTSDVTGSFSYGGSWYPSGYSVGSYTSSFGGTSSACPLVAGVSALVLSANPSLSSKKVKDILQTTARKIGRATGFTPEFGHGCVNAAAAVVEARKPIVLLLASSTSSSTTQKHELGTTGSN